MFSSKSDEWETPQELFDELNKEFNFEVDAAASDENHKCDIYFKKNPDPFHCDGLTADVVMLVPARTDTKWFHDYIYNKENVEIRFLNGRLKFGNAKNSAPFPSMIVVFK